MEKLPHVSGACLVAQTVKNLLAMQETQAQSLGQKDLLEEGMANNPSILLWRIPWCHKESDMTKQLTLLLLYVR